MELCLPPPGNGLHLRRNIVTTTIEAFRKLALSLPQAEEKAHFDLPSFRVGNKIFATIHAKPGRVMIKLSPVDQSVFCRADTIAIYPVPGYWGKGGATFFELKKVRKAVLADALQQAWLRVAPKKLVEEYNDRLKRK